MHFAITGWHARQWIATAVSAWAIGASAQPVASWTIPPGEQRQRDAQRQRILEDELRAEESARAEASARYTERQRAGDAFGAADAQSALTRHEANIAALRQELMRVERTSPSGRGADARAFEPAPALVKSRAITPATAAAKQMPALPRRWDLYAGAAAGEARSSEPPVGQSPWDIYSPRTTGIARREAATQGEGVGSSVRPFVVYRDPQAAGPSGAATAPARNLER